MTERDAASEATLQEAYRFAPPADPVEAANLLKEARQIVEGLGITFFLRQGTCLGAVRDNAIIPWDDDVDIGGVIGLHGLTEESVYRVADAFRAKGYYTKQYTAMKNGKVIMDYIEVPPQLPPGGQPERSGRRG